MYPRQHIILGFLFSLVLYLLTPITLVPAIVIFLSSVLIDIDHYLYYLYLKKDFNLKRSFKWFLKMDKKYFSLSKDKQKKYYHALCWFHGIDILILFSIISFFYKPFLYPLIGFSFHYFLDILGAFFSDEKEGHSFSIIYNFIKTRKLKHLDNEK